jgi:hypothetical protein
MTDPLIEEARRAGQAFIDSFGGDLKAACAELRRRAEADGRTVVSLSPKLPVSGDLPPPATPTKKVG